MSTEGHGGSGSASELHTCPACARHVKLAETRCPFCGTELATRGETHRVRQAVTIGLLAGGGIIVAAAGTGLLGSMREQVPVYGAPYFGPGPVRAPARQKEAAKDAGSDADAAPREGSQARPSRRKRDGPGFTAAPMQRKSRP